VTPSPSLLERRSDCGLAVLSLPGVPPGPQLMFALVALLGVLVPVAENSARESWMPPCTGFSRHPRAFLLFFRSRKLP